MNEDIKTYDDKKRRHGYWELYDERNVKLMYKCFFINGKISGYDEDYFLSNLTIIFHL